VETGERRFQVRLASERVGLSGEVDLLIVTNTEAVPVEFKHTEGPVAKNHRLQLGAYALLVEDALGLPVQRGFVCQLPAGRLWQVQCGTAERLQVAQLVRQVRHMLAGEARPAPTPVRARCRDCEFRRYCSDLE